jgi:endonuclease YncB( thermonuclease family)
MNIEKRTFRGIKKYVKLYRVYDGDTIEIITKLDRFERNKRYMFRLNGLDAPEIKPKMNIKFRNDIINMGIKVKEILEMVLTKDLYIEFDGEDKYGRLLGTVWTVKRGLFCCKSQYLNVNNWLLMNNLVLPYNGGQKTEISKYWLDYNKTNVNMIYDNIKIGGIPLP